MSSGTAAGGDGNERTILVTGSTGKLGRHVIGHLLDAGVNPGDIAGLARDAEKASDLADRGIDVRIGDYTEPDTLRDALAGIDRLLLISSSAIGERVEQHGNVIEAAEHHDVSYIAYTSLLRADRSPMGIADEHVATEEMIRDAGIPYTFLRNGWYTENYTEEALDQALEQGAFVGCAGDGRISAATRSDYAEAAATVLTEDGHEGEVYELAGDDPFTMAGLAEEVSRQSDTEVVYRDLPDEEYRDALIEQGMPEAEAAALVEMDQAIAEGALSSESDDLRTLIGHPTTPLAEAVAAALGE